MAKDLSVQDGVDNVTAGYLNGKIKDTETKVGEGINNDIVQFFQKLMDLAGLSPNGNYDNETNGYQFIDALKSITIVNSAWVLGTLEAGWNGSLRYFKTNDGIVHVRISQIYPNTGFSDSGSFFWAPPAGYRPSGDYRVVIIQGPVGAAVTNTIHSIRYFTLGDKFAMEGVPDAVVGGDSNNNVSAYLVYRADG